MPEPGISWTLAVGSWSGTDTSRAGSDTAAQKRDRINVRGCAVSHLRRSEIFGGAREWTDESEFWRPCEGRFIPSRREESRPGPRPRPLAAARADSSLGAAFRFPGGPIVNECPERPTFSTRPQHSTVLPHKSRRFEKCHAVASVDWLVVPAFNPKPAGSPGCPPARERA